MYKIRYMLIYGKSKVEMTYVNMYIYIFSSHVLLKHRNRERASQAQGSQLTGCHFTTYPNLSS